MKNDSISSVLVSLTGSMKKHGAEKMDKILACISDIHAVGEKYGQEVFTAAIETVLDLAKHENQL